MSPRPGPRDDKPPVTPDTGGMDRRLTAILSKRPLPGRVKTRLCPPLSHDEAARLQAAMLRDVVERCCGSRDFRCALVYSPQGDGGWFRETFPGLEDQRPQVGEGLAQRLAHLFETTLCGDGSLREVQTLVAVGSDQPLLSTRRIAKAHRCLEEGADLVLGPDSGGGYYLVGQRAAHPELFTEIEMSTTSMFEETVRLAESSGLTVELLGKGYDVDVRADLERLHAELGARFAQRAETDPEFPRFTWSILQSLYPLKS